MGSGPAGALAGAELKEGTLSSKQGVRSLGGDLEALLSSACEGFRAGPSLCPHSCCLASRRRSGRSKLAVRDGQLQRQPYIVLGCRAF